jgi:hypothetical protein
MTLWTLVRPDAPEVVEAAQSRTRAELELLLARTLEGYTTDPASG